MTSDVKVQGEGHLSTGRVFHPVTDCCEETVTSLWQDVSHTNKVCHQEKPLTLSTKGFYISKFFRSKDFLRGKL